ncbi:conserved hypothetical protein [Paecilomyces variotii No. 5]|uniref:Cyclin-D1-binding protein 1-like N-terminal domain-containing protein n=1 Tax=Byssochlamys spectabilis (strain No. 5 / NBRC 109023) TaxID=1356009 RepID=V5G233_BYSSN|nr:conserved hypothetical protein [Paecilomyces variotii No. 5]
MADRLQRLLATTLALSEQFQSTLSTTPAVSSSQTEEKATDSENAGPAPLPLLSASATALKAQVTKLSLLAINAPFTPSAVNSILSAVNDSVLPSLLTAALLVTDAAYTKLFRAEVHALVKTLLKELSGLVGEVKVVADKKDRENKGGKKEEELPAPEKDSVVGATGRVWDACDVVVEIAGKGVVGFVIRRVEEWRDLVKDAIGELEEWDPADDDDDDWDNLLNGDGEDGGDDEDDEDEEEEETAALNEQKKTALRALKPISAMYPAIISNRLKKGGLETSADVLLSSSHLRALETLMADLQSIPEHIDEAAGSLYEADIKKSNSYLCKAKGHAVKVVKSLILPWTAEGAEAKTPEEDKFSVWSKTWLKVIEEVTPDLEKGR